MSDQKQVSDQNQESSALPDATNDKVSYDTYRKVLNEAKKTKELLKQLETERQASNETKLKEQNEWKQLAEQYQNQLKQTSQKLEEQESSIVNGIKYQAFEKFLGGRLKNDEYSSFIPFDRIILDPETKRINEDSAKLAVSDFIKNHSHLVEFSSGKLPNAASSGFGQTSPKSPSDMSLEDIEKELKTRFK